MAILALSRWAGAQVALLGRRMPDSCPATVTPINLAALPDVFQLLPVLDSWWFDVGAPHRYAPAVTAGAGALPLLAGAWHARTESPS